MLVREMPRHDFVLAAQRRSEHRKQQYQGKQRDKPRESYLCGEVRMSAHDTQSAAGDQRSIPKFLGTQEARAHDFRRRPQGSPACRWTALRDDQARVVATGSSSTTSTPALLE